MQGDQCADANFVLGQVTPADSGTSRWFERRMQLITATAHKFSRQDGEDVKLLNESLAEKARTHMLSTQHAPKWDCLALADSGYLFLT